MTGPPPGALCLANSGGMAPTWYPPSRPAVHGKQSHSCVDRKMEVKGRRGTERLRGGGEEKPKVAERDRGGGGERLRKWSVHGHQGLSRVDVRCQSSLLLHHLLRITLLLVRSSSAHDLTSSPSARLFLIGSPLSLDSLSFGVWRNLWRLEKEEVGYIDWSPPWRSVLGQQWRDCTDIVPSLSVCPSWRTVT